MDKYYIWSLEHGSWWASDENGYAPKLMYAGLYTEARAREICINANKYLPCGVVHEVMIPENALMECTNEL